MDDARTSFKTRSRDLDRLMAERKEARKAKQAARKQELESAIAALKQEIAAIRSEFTAILADVPRASSA
jgi:outer membrane murein-binding lipoprotein Lpp